MRFLTLWRFVLLCAVGVMLWMRPAVLRAQYGGDCSKYDTMELCCDDAYGNQFCEADNCLQEIDDLVGDGTQEARYASANCSTRPGAPPGSCTSFSDYVPVDNPDCYTYCGGVCYSDDDCCGDTFCSNDISGDPTGRCESVY